MGTCRPPRLIAVSPGCARDLQGRLKVGHRLKSLFEAGLEGCVLREPKLSDAELLALAVDLRRAFPFGAGKWICVHDRLHVAQAAGADAVHLGFRSLALNVALRGLPAGLGLGLSTHAHDDPETWKGADYIFHGPVFQTPSKTGWVKPVGLNGLKRARRCGVPIWGLGGVEPANIEAVLSTGVHGAAMLRAFTTAAPAIEVMQDLLSKLAISGNHQN